MLNTVAAVFIFGIIILIHEFGHFLFAKINGVKVIEFSVGMGPRLVSVRRGETRYSVKCLPFGGSCMMEGDEGDTQSKRSFNSKPVPARIAVIAAGPGFNFILAFLAAMVIVFQAGHDDPVIHEVMPGFPAVEAGLKAGDRITRIDHRSIYATRDISLYFFSHPGKEVTVSYERPYETQGKTVYEKKQAVITPRYSEEYQSYMLGASFEGYRKSENLFEFLGSSLYELRYIIRSTTDSLGMLFRQQIKADDAVAGPIKIVSMMGDTVESSRKQGAWVLLYVIASWILMLSTSLGFMNLLPLPALDGGRLLFLLIELVRGKPIAPDKEGLVHAFGMFLLMVFMVWVLYRDMMELMFHG